MNISLKNLVMPSCFLAAGAFISCDNMFAENNAVRYCRNHDKTQLELEQILSDDNETRSVQSKLDSMAYRDIFNSTCAAKDSAAVAQFNKIASKYDNTIEARGLDNIKKDGISAREFDEITAVGGNLRQFKTDKFAYRNFFKKIGIMNDGLDKKCTEFEKEISQR